MLLVGCQAPAAVDTFTDADVAAITADLEGFTTALLEGRFSDVAATYPEDTIFMPPYQEKKVNREIGNNFKNYSPLMLSSYLPAKEKMAS